MEYAQVIARVEPAIKDALDGLKESDGLLLEYQIRMGLLMWLESRGINPLKNQNKRGAIRDAIRRKAGITGDGLYRSDKVGKPKPR